MSAKNPISILQEICACRKKPLPQYILIPVGTINEPSFLCKVKCEDVTAEATAKNKKDAKQKAAEQVLMSLGSKYNAPQVQLTSIGPYAEENYIGKLNEYASKMRQLQPVYLDSISGGYFITTCKFMSYTTMGEGTNKKSSKQKSAQLMWNIIEPLGLATNSDVILLQEDEKTTHVIKTFQNLSVNNNNNTMNITNSIPNTQSLSLIRSVPLEHYTLTDLEKELLLLTTYKIITFQKDPLILQMVTSNGMHVFSTANTREAAFRDLFKSALNLLGNGISEKTDLITF